MIHIGTLSRRLRAFIRRIDPNIKIFSGQTAEVSKACLYNLTLYKK